jgi:hypothetical protein
VNNYAKKRSSITGWAAEQSEPSHSIMSKKIGKIRHIEKRNILEAL